MISTAQSLPPKPAMPPSAAAPAPAQPAGGPSFAQFLTEQSASPAPQPAADGASPADTADEDRNQTRRLAAQRRNAQAPAPHPLAPATTAGKADAEPAAPADASTAVQALASDAETDTDDSPETPELKEFAQLIGLTQPPSPAPAVALPSVETQTGTGLPPADTDEPQRGKADKRSAPVVAERSTEPAGNARTEPRAEARPAARSAGQIVNATESRQAAAETQTSAPAARTDATPTTSFAATLAQTLATPAARTDAPPAPLPTATLHAPLHSPAFAPELGARVSLMAVDGVQHAELQLNPAEMGPVTVQIVVDGNQAQVSFQALQAETRQALEQSLPDLAAALQGQGLTLSGGGVSQQSAGNGAAQGDGRGQPANPDSRNSTAGGSAEPALATAPPAHRSVGLLDAFA